MTNISTLPLKRIWLTQEGLNDPNYLYVTASFAQSLYERARKVCVNAAPNYAEAEYLYITALVFYEKAKYIGETDMYDARISNIKDQIDALQDMRRPVDQPLARITFNSQQ